MKKAILSTSLVALVAGLGLFASTSRGQSGAPAAAPVPHKVGLIDMAEVFKNYEKFKVKTESLKAEVESTTQRMKALTEKTKELQASLKEYKPGTTQREQLETDILNNNAQLQVLRTKTQVELARKEAAIYREIYEEVQDAVSKYASYYKYTLVLRYSSEDLGEDGQPPQVVIQKLNQLVVYNREEDDITTPIVNYLNKKFRPTPPRGN